MIHPHRRRQWRLADALMRIEKLTDSGKYDAAQVAAFDSIG